MNSDLTPAGAGLPRIGSKPNLLAPPAAPRLFLGLFGCILALVGLWLLLPELLRPKALGFPSAKTSAAAASDQASARAAALWAARIGWIRGDLWAEAAYANSDLLAQGRAAALDRATAERLDRVRGYAERALTLAPINGAAWLFLAALPAAPTRGGADRVGPALEMSYYTAQNDLDLAELRLERAAASAALATDRELQDFVKGEMRRILDLRPQLKSAIAGAHRAAGPQNRPLFEGLANEVDPALAQALRAGTAK